MFLYAFRTEIVAGLFFSSLLFRGFLLNAMDFFFFKVKSGFRIQRLTGPDEHRDALTLPSGAAMENQLFAPHLLPLIGVLEIKPVFWLKHLSTKY